MPPRLNQKRARFVLAKIDEILGWERQTDRERDARFVDLGRYLCEVRAGQFWRLENLKSFDEFLERRFPESRRKAYYLMSIHEHLPRQIRKELKQIGWSKATELAKVARRDPEHSICATWLRKAQEMPKQQFKDEVEKFLTGNSEPSDLIYFKLYRSQVSVVEQALEVVARMLGSDRSRGYCLEMICADFLAGASLEDGNAEVLLISLRQIYRFLPQQQQQQFLNELRRTDITRRSRLLDGTEPDVNWARVIEVPMNFKREFDKDPDACVRDYAGISTLSIKPFLMRREMIRKMFELGKEKGLQHPFSVMDATLQHKDPDYERLLPDNLHWVMRTKMNELGRPLMRNNQPVREKILYPTLYHAHFDLSKTGDATGLCVGHVVGTRKCLRFDEDTMRDTEEIKPVIRIDWIQRIVPPPHGEIDIPRVRALLYRLTALGMEFGSITCDQFGSQESVKTLKEKGYRADTFSLDENKDGYSALKDAIYDGRVLCYRHPVLERELAQLEDTGKKIDHPSSPGSSKDLADCLAAVVHHCEEGWRHGERIGGLFELGLVEYAGEPKENPTRDRAITKVAQGEKVTDAEESATFGDFDDWG